MVYCLVIVFVQCIVGLWVAGPVLSKAIENHGDRGNRICGLNEKSSGASSQVIACDRLGSAPPTIRGLNVITVAKGVVLTFCLFGFTGIGLGLMARRSLKQASDSHDKQIETICLPHPESDI